MLLTKNLLQVARNVNTASKYYVRILQIEETISPLPTPLSSYARYIPFLLSHNMRYLLL